MIRHYKSPEVQTFTVSLSLCLSDEGNILAFRDERSSGAVNHQEPFNESLCVCDVGLHFL